MLITNDERILITGLERLALSSATAPGDGLNAPLRQSLKDFAADRGHSFKQDDIGNIYITRSGLDKEQSAIALTFDVDSHSPTSVSLLAGALQVFISLEHSETACDVTLLGWSSPRGHPIGRNVWESSLSTSAAYDRAPELKAFMGLPDVGTFDLAAVLRTVEDESEKLVVDGSPVLTEKVRKVVHGRVKMQVCREGMVNVPNVSLWGKNAVAVSKEVVDLYSRYVAGLFENFD